MPDDDETELPITATYDVSLGNPGESDVNTIVLSGVKIVVPLEVDLDGDPLHDDEVRLRSEDGGFEEILLASDDDVKFDADKNLMMHTFRNVPPGAYRVAVRIGTVWTDVLLGLVVTKKGVFHGGTKLDEEPKAVKLGAPAPQDEPEQDPEPDEAPALPDDFMDVNDGFADRES